MSLSSQVMRRIHLAMQAPPGLFRAFLLAGCTIGAAACASAHGVPSVQAAIPKFSVDSLTHDSTGAILCALVGTVQDSASGLPVGDAIVSLTSIRGQHYYSPTDQFGGFVVQRVPPGSYDLLVRKIAYQPYAAPHSMRAGVIDTLRLQIRELHLFLSTAQGPH
jgi:carboxypeptidase family protein